MTAYTLRQATNDDYEFLFSLHEAAMREYVEATGWGWQEEWQREYFDRKFDPLRRQIIQVQGQDIGVIAIEERDDELYVALIEILPEFQSRGIGTRLLGQTIDSAHRMGRPIALHVLKSNEPARRLYERLGFIIVEDDEEHRCKMAFAPPT